MSSLQDPDQLHASFDSGGGLYGAFTYGVREGAADADEPIPDVVVPTSAAFGNGFALKVYQHRLNKLRKAGHEPDTAERRALRKQCLQRFWDCTVNDFGWMAPFVQHFETPDVMKALTVGMARLGATFVDLSGRQMAAMKPFDPLNILGSMNGWVQRNANDQHFWVQWLKRVYPDAEEALADPDTLRIISLSYNMATGEPVTHDTHPPKGKPATLAEHVGTMTLPQNMALVGGVLADGAVAGFNGDNFDVLTKLIEENPAFAKARVTFINLGEPDVLPESILATINPRYAANRMAAAAMKEEVARLFDFREITLDRDQFPGGKAKMVVTPEAVAALHAAGMEAYQNCPDFTRVPNRPAMAQYIVARLRAAAYATNAPQAA